MMMFVWDNDKPTKKKTKINYVTQFKVNKILNDEIEKES
jgi:hypothetical protein